MTICSGAHWALPLSETDVQQAYIHARTYLIYLERLVALEITADPLNSCKLICKKLRRLQSARRPIKSQDWLEKHCEEYCAGFKRDETRTKMFLQPIGEVDEAICELTLGFMKAFYGCDILMTASMDLDDKQVWRRAG